MPTVMATAEATAVKPRILCVDDEPLVLEGLRDVLRRSFDVQVATSGAAGLALLRANKRGYSIVISDMRMPEMPGSVFLGEARRIAPLAVRMLLTGYADTDAAIKAINDGQIFRFLTKPCDRDELIRACAGALWQHRVIKTERDLLEQTLHGSVKALTDVLALASPTVFGRSARLKELVGALARETGWDDAWEVEVAALLAQLGGVTLPETTAEKLYAGAPLTTDEEAMVARVPAVTQRILANIPRLEGVVQIVTSYRRRFDSTESDGPLPVGGRMLAIAADFVRLESEGTSPLMALETMRGRKGAYDEELLEAFARTIGIGEHTLNIIEVAVRDLQIGMTLVHEIRAKAGHLLIAPGYPVTEELIERLRNVPDGYVREPVRVSLAPR
jgi:response regulator RpfG family c-di-GMP phosphodiesterase